MPDASTQRAATPQRGALRRRWDLPDVDAAPVPADQGDTAPPVPAFTVPAAPRGGISVTRVPADAYPNAAGMVAESVPGFTVDGPDGVAAALRDMGHDTGARFDLSFTASGVYVAPSAQ